MSEEQGYYYDLIVESCWSLLRDEVRAVINRSNLVPLGAPFATPDGSWVQAMVHRDLPKLDLPTGDPNK